MINVIKESFIFKVFYNLIMLSYENSFLKKSFSNIKNVIKNSKTSYILHSYMYKKPYFLSSLIYKIFRKIINFFDKISDFFNSVLNKIINSSKFIYNAKNLNRYYIYKNITALNLCISSFTIGYSLGLLIVIKSINIRILLIFIYLIVIYIFFNKNYFKNSFFYRLFKLLYRLVKM